jgi:hypothetical protein
MFFIPIAPIINAVLQKRKKEETLLEQEKLKTKKQCNTKKVINTGI